MPAAMGGVLLKGSSLCGSRNIILRVGKHTGAMQSARRPLQPSIIDKCRRQCGLKLNGKAVLR